MAPLTAGQPDAYTDPQVAAQGGVLSRLGVFIGCEGECREALIAGDLEGALQESKLAGWTERDVRLLCWLRRAFGRGPASSAVARLRRRLCWAAVGASTHSAPARLCA